jgi:hypothetical protein
VFGPVPYQSSFSSEGWDHNNVMGEVNVRSRQKKKATGKSCAAADDDDAAAARTGGREKRSILKGSPRTHAARPCTNCSTPAPRRRLPPDRVRVCTYSYVMRPG